MDTIRVSLAPSPGFCVKTVALQTAVCKITPPLPAAKAASKLDVPTVDTPIVTIPKGLKVFVNVAWDQNVPPPPEGSEDAIQRAMIGDEDPDERNEQGWFVPVVVSQPREDRDKAGKLSAVFDCVYHSSLKSRTLKDPEFKTFLIELAFQRIETQWGLLLSRQIGTPNIKSKGELHPRTVLIPAALFPGDQPAGSSVGQSGRNPSKNLVEEITTPSGTQKPQGILKRADTAVANPTDPSAVPSPEFSWSKGEDGLKVYLRVPDLYRSHISSATLDLEPRRLILNVPPVYALDLNLDLPDAQIRDSLQLSKLSVDQALTLKRQRDFDIDHARAEWKVAEGRLIVHV